VSTVAAAMKKARDMVHFFNKSMRASKKLKVQQKESSLAKYSGQPKNILQDVKTRWWSTYPMLKRLQFLRDAISHYIVNNPEGSPETLTAQEWKVCHQIKITLKTMAFWQRVLEGDKHFTGSLIPVAIYTIRQSFLQVIASQAADPVVKQLTRNMLNNFDRRYHPTMDGELIYKREVSVGHGNWYIAIHPYFLRQLFSTLASTIL
jgi:hypothetical protein